MKARRAIPRPISQEATSPAFSSPRKFRSRNPIARPTGDAHQELPGRHAQRAFHAHHPNPLSRRILPAIIRSIGIGPVEERKA
jgi:hypothetical protein